MKPIHLRLAALLLILGGLGLIGLAARKTVTLQIGDESRTITTFGFTVGDVLALAEVELGPQDRLYPPAKTRLHDGQAITIERAATVQVRAGRQVRLFQTLERRPGNILILAGVRLYPNDRVFVDERAVAPAELLPLVGRYNIQVQRALAVTLIEGQASHTFYTSAATLGEALTEAGVQLEPPDRISPAPDTPLTAPITVTLYRGQAVAITVEGETFQTQTTALTVGEALIEAGYPLQGVDYSRPPAEALIPDDGQIRVIRVREEIAQEQEPVPFEVLYQPLPDVEIDNVTLLQDGVNGVWTRSFRVRYEDGQEVSRKMESEWMEVEPQPRVIGYGAKIVVRTLNTSGGAIRYWRALPMYAVSYNPTSAGGTITASGLPLQKGVAGIDPTYIPFFTRLYIPGYGEAIAADTGPGIQPRMIDLGYSDDDYVHWSQNVTVYFLTPVPPAEEIVWIIP
ncbi:MAG: ubiquitin-like domain-containing protein [Anaerolineales bacterium]